MKHLNKNIKQTQKIAGEIAKKLKGGEVIALSGELGAGKTVFVKSLAKSLGVKKNVNSPTFVLMKIYQTKNPKSNIKRLCHIDAYRIENFQDLLNIGVLEFLGQKNTTCAIEWAEKIKKILPKNRIEINLKTGKKENRRDVFINFLK
ncbi:MAG: ATP/GTP hydrolase [Parcubacteria group bacterium Athens1014_10]|nr:MAG: ATP/GTP hydrolase [Parcubacteria group bacterium Athens1014_10]TSD05123.1 MAG: ATP/GTP hydrolase [Parcubacteria group bacterium Athens0714_12]